MASSLRIKEDNDDKLVILSDEKDSAGKFKIARVEEGKNTVHIWVDDEEPPMFLNNEYTKLLRDWLSDFLVKEEE